MATPRNGNLPAGLAVAARAFPLAKLTRLIASRYGVSSLEGLLSRHLDLRRPLAAGAEVL